jgi:hypothetical protein
MSFHVWSRLLEGVKLYNRPCERCCRIRDMPMCFVPTMLQRVWTIQPFAPIRCNLNRFRSSSMHTRMGSGMHFSLSLMMVHYRHGVYKACSPGNCQLTLSPTSCYCSSYPNQIFLSIHGHLESVRTTLLISSWLSRSRFLVLSCPI